MSQADTTPSSPRLAAALGCAAIVLGFTSIVAQVVLTRELLDVFLGNELSIAVVLACWLLLVAAGSAVGTLLRISPRAALSAVIYAQLAAWVLLPCAIVIARLVPFGGVASGEAPGIPAILSISILSLAPVCLLIGFQFVLLCRALESAAQPRAAVPHPDCHSERSEESLCPSQPAVPSAHVGRIYALEAVGAIIGGLAFYFLMAERFGALQSMLLLGCTNGIGVAAVIGAVVRTPRRRVLFVICAAVMVGSWLLFLAVVAAGEAGHASDLVTRQFSPRWRNTTISQQVASRYGNLVVAERAGQIAIYQSGVLLFTSQDDEANEAVAHLALLEHPAPRRVLLIGGGASGVAHEVLKHGVARLDYVELDPRIISLARTWLPAQLVASLSDPRVHVHLGDGRLFVKNTRLHFDVVIVSLPDPTTASLNRFYTQEFFSEVARKMNPGAVLVTRLTSSEAYMGGAMRLATASVHRSLRAVFADALIVPGEMLFLLAANKPGVLTSDWRVLAQRLRERRVRCRFVTPFWLQEALLPFRREMAMAVLREQRRARPNHDLTPVAYHYQMTLWLEQMSPRLAGMLDRLRGMSLWWFAPPILAALIWAAAAPRRWSRPAAGIVGMAAMGGFGLAGEFLALLVFQSARGYLYHQLGILFALFMGGLAAGAFWATKQALGREGWAERWFLVSLVAAAALAVALSAAAVACLRWENLAMPLMGIFLVAAGFVDGSAFPAAVSVYAAGRGAARAGGLIYAADLAGSAFGALATACAIVPVMGICGASLAIALAMLCAAVLSAPLLRA